MFNKEAKIYSQIGGFMKGICHPGGEFQLMTDAGFNWVRRDVPYPFDADGNPTPEHLHFLEETRIFAEHGLRTVAISPYPREFIARGMDCTTEEGLAQVTEVCARLAKEYAPYNVCWQATNEMFIVDFRAPLTTEQSKYFVIASLKGLKQGDPKAAVGHNCVDGGIWDEYAVDINEVCECDYLGYDFYNGSWGNGDTDSYVERAAHLYNLVHLPIILMEFGFSSFGKNCGPEDVQKYLNDLGFADMNDVQARRDEFIETLPPKLRASAQNCAEEDIPLVITSMMPHLLKAWFTEKLFPHTEEGQAEFYAELLPKLIASPHIAGLCVFCWYNSHMCFTCESHECPCETAWGMLRSDGTPKPSYYAVKEAFTKNPTL